MGSVTVLAACFTNKGVSSFFSQKTSLIGDSSLYIHWRFSFVYDLQTQKKFYCWYAFLFFPRIWQFHFFVWQVPEHIFPVSRYLTFSFFYTFVPLSNFSASIIPFEDMVILSVNGSGFCCWVRKTKSWWIGWNAKN